MMHGWGFPGGRAGFPRRFEEQYHCYSVAYADKAHLEVSVCVIDRDNDYATRNE